MWTNVREKSFLAYKNLILASENSVILPLARLKTKSKFIEFH
jgi:hypothetical protein